VSRRTLTLLLSGLLSLLLTAGAAAAQVPYVALGPGPTFDTLGTTDGKPVIDISGRQTYPTDGHLDLTTVGVQRRLTLTEALVDWFRSDRAVVPRELVFPPNRTDAQITAENTQQMTSSQSSATTAALRQLGLPFTLDVAVAKVEPALPAAGRLEPGDVVRAVNGAPVRDAAGLRALVQGTAVGKSLAVAYERAGTAAETILAPVAAPDGSGRSVIGVTLVETPRYGFTITINLMDVGGPSAGLMFALGIVDKLAPDSLTGGRYIAGTGEITDDGSVRPIGGISQKLLAASSKGAQAFLVPADNCREAAAHPPAGLRLVKVSSLQDAVGALKALRDGGSPASCTS